MIVDYHMHLRNGREEIAHDTSSVDPFVDAARRAGVEEIGFTEHAYYFRQTRPLWTVPYQTERCVYNLDAYVDAIGAARARGLPVKLGLEVDYVRGREDETRELLVGRDFDRARELLRSAGYETITVFERRRAHQEPLG